MLRRAPCRRATRSAILVSPSASIPYRPRREATSGSADHDVRAAASKSPRQPTMQLLLSCAVHPGWMLPDA